LRGRFCQKPLDVGERQETGESSVAVDGAHRRSGLAELGECVDQFIVLAQRESSGGSIHSLTARRGHSSRGMCATRPKGSTPTKLVVSNDGVERVPCGACALVHEGRDRLIG